MTKREWTQRETSRLELAVERAADGVLVLDATNRVVLANPSICAMLGYGHDEIVGLDILETYLPEDRRRAPSVWSGSAPLQGRSVSSGSCVAETGAPSQSRSW
ncbi:MAG: PAS domain-containing protein [Candidatus Limnocylindrales bacterium]|jgi:PAS domain S-box-containing protein